MTKGAQVRTFHHHFTIIYFTSGLRANCLGKDYLCPSLLLILQHLKNIKKIVMSCCVYSKTFFLFLAPEDEARSVISDSTRVGLKVNTQPVFQPSSTPESLQHRFMVCVSGNLIVV